MVTESIDVRSAIKTFLTYIQGETLAVSLVLESLAGVEPVEVMIAGSEVKIFVKVAERQKD